MRQTQRRQSQPAPAGSGAIGRCWFSR